VRAQTRVLKLPTVGHDCDPLARQALAEAWPPLQHLRSLLDAELASRAERAIERRLHAARLPAQKILAQFDWRRAHGLERAHVEELGRCAWIPAARNVVLSGPVARERPIWPPRSASRPSNAVTTSPSTAPPTWSALSPRLAIPVPSRVCKSDFAASPFSSSMSWDVRHEAPKHRVDRGVHPGPSQRLREAEGRRSAGMSAEPGSSPDNVAKRRHYQTSRSRKQDGKA
jgi:hypothetical protein